MMYRVIGPFFFAIIWLPTWVTAQTNGANATLDSLAQSHIAIFKTVGITDTAKAIVRVMVKEIGSSNEPIQGATVLLRRDKDKMLGRVTKQDGRCNFMPTPAIYGIRVQLTGYKSLDTSGLLFERGKVYELELRVARN
jgi:hypothetical protein